MSEYEYEYENADGTVKVFKGIATVKNLDKPAAFVALVEGTQIDVWWMDSHKDKAKLLELYKLMIGKEVKIVVMPCKVSV